VPARPELIARGRSLRLEMLQVARLARTVLGSYFDWSDFPYYFLGSALGYLWVRLMPQRQ